jgi:triosephosphate isomerase
MNGTVKEARDLAAALKKELGRDPGPEVLVCPPYLALAAVHEELEGSPIALGAPDVHWEAKGAFTGEISIPMLREAGCSAVLIGHSERRHIMGETHEMVNRKLRAALAAGLLPIVCVGELLEERNMGDTRAVVERQVAKGFDGVSGRTPRS